MNPPAIFWIASTGAAAYGYMTGRFSNVIEHFKKEDGSGSSSSRSAQYLPENNQQPTIIVQPSDRNGRNSYFLPMGTACLVGLAGYYYYIHNNGTKKVIHNVQKTAQQTQDLVQKSDDNNSKRFETLDQQNEKRAKDLELEIRAEQRTGLSVISEQLYCLTQLSVQTLSALASGQVNRNADSENNDYADEKLLGYCDKAQEMSDTLMSDDHFLKTKETKREDIKAEIVLRANKQPNHAMHNAEITPGGPSSPNSNPYQMNQQQPHHVVDFNGVPDLSIEDEDADGDVRTRLVRQSLQMAHYVYSNVNKEKIALASSILAGLYIVNKTVDYLSSSNRKEELRA